MSDVAKAMGIARKIEFVERQGKLSPASKLRLVQQLELDLLAALGEPVAVLDPHAPGTGQIGAVQAPRPPKGG